MPLYKIILYNDHVNEMPIVTLILQQILGLSYETADSIMMTAHQTGSAVCKIEPMERAEYHRDQLLAQNLSVAIEEA